MKILITGEAGNAGKGLTDILAKDHELVLYYIQKMDTKHRFY